MELLPGLPGISGNNTRRERGQIWDGPVLAEIKEPDPDRGLVETATAPLAEP